MASRRGVYFSYGVIEPRGVDSPLFLCYNNLEKAEGKILIITFFEIKNNSLAFLFANQRHLNFIVFYVTSMAAEWRSIMKRFVVFVLIVILSLGALSLTSCKSPEISDNTDAVTGSEGLTYELNVQRDGYIVTGMGTCTDTCVVIPSTYNGLPVMSIAKGAFQATVPPVTDKPSDNNGKDNDKDKEKQEKLSLSGTSLLSATTSDGIVNEKKPEANITEVVIPDSVMDIGDEAFYGCEELASFEVSNLISLIGTDAFKNTAYYLDESNWTGDSLYLEEYLVEVRDTVSGSYTVRDGTVNIASNAFEGCAGITSVTFPSSLRFVGKMSFLGCAGITEIDLSIPGIQIEANAFEGCTALRSVKIATNDVPNAPPVGSNLGFGVDRVDEVFMPGGISDIAFDPTADPNLIYSSSIGPFAFKDCTALASVTFGSNVGYFGGFVFSGCTSLRSVDMSMITAHDPSTVIVTPSNNHRWHMSLQGLFDGCTSLEEVKLPNCIQWLDTTFRGCTSLKEFTVPNTVKGLNKTFSECTSLKEITLPESVIALSETFSGCTSLAEIKLHDKLVKIGRKTFSGCYSLTSVYVPDSVTEIGDFAFSNNETLTVSVGKGIKSIGKEAINFVYTIVYRGTMNEWGEIELHERWGGMSPNEDYADIICSNGTIVDGETFTESMTGILLADGTVYGSFFGITVKLYPDSRDEIVSLTLAEIETELKAAGAEGWRYVSAVEIAGLKDCNKFTCYERIKQMARYNNPTHNKPQDKPEEESGSSGNTGTSTDRNTKAIMLEDGTLYVYINKVTIVVKDGKVEQSDIPFPKISSNLVNSGRKDWRSVSEKDILVQYGEEIFKEIMNLSKKVER